MNLSSVDFLKGQAARLVAYLGDKHRFRLKTSSALEAVAAMYETDWNTLCALAERKITRPPFSGSAPARYPLTWNSRAEPELSVEPSDWFRHTLVEGGTVAARRKWLDMQLVAHIGRGAPGVFVNLFGAERAVVRDIFGELTHVGADDAAEAIIEVNVLADMAPGEIAAMLVELAFSRDAGTVDRYWTQSAQRVLAVTAQALVETGQVVTLASLVELFPFNAPPARLEHLAAQMAPGAATREHLSSILASITAIDGAFSANTWAAHYRVLARSLANLQSEEWVSALFSGDGKAPGLYGLLSQGECLGVEWPDGAGHKPGVALVHALNSAMRARQATGSKAADWVFALGEVQGYISPALTDMVQVGRASRVALLLTAQDSCGIACQSTGREILANVWNNVQLQPSPERLAALVARAGAAVLVQPDRLIVPLG